MSLGAIETLTQDAEPSGTTLIGSHNGFNDLSRLAILWTVQHFWSEGVRFVFNFYRQWAQLLMDAATGREDPWTYRMEFQKGGAKTCPVEGCPGRAGTRTAMRVHFWRRHVRDTVIILEEGSFLTLDARTATCWCRGGPLMGATRIQQCVGAAQNGSGGGIQKRKSGRVQRGLSRPTGDNWSRSPGLLTWGG